MAIKLFGLYFGMTSDYKVKKVMKRIDSTLKEVVPANDIVFISSCPQGFQIPNGYRYLGSTIQDKKYGLLYRETLQVEEVWCKKTREIVANISETDSITLLILAGKIGILSINAKDTGIPRSTIDNIVEENQLTILHANDTWSKKHQISFDCWTSLRRYDEHFIQAYKLDEIEVIYTDSAEEDEDLRDNKHQESSDS